MKNQDESNTKASLKQIAQMAGVSIATVSRVINNNGRFSEETRKRVMAIIRETNYKTNTLAKGLRMRRSNSIGILVPDLTNDFFSRTVQEIEKKLFKLGYSTIICDTQRDPEMEHYYLDTLEAKSIDGLIVISGNQPFDSNELTESVPVLCIDREPKNADTFFISSDHKTGALIATQRLIDRGYSPICVSRDHESTSRRDRIAGFKHALALNDRETTEENFLELSGRSYQEYQQELVDFLKKNTDKRLGLFCLGDFLAAIGIKAAQQLKLSVPQDIGFVGFDDGIYASLLTPTLTTIRQDIDAIASMSVDTMTKLIADPNADIPKKVQVPVTIVARESC